MNTSKLAIVGTGYVGLVVGACFAEHGRFVTCIDRNADKIARLQKGEVPFYEPGLETLITRNMENERLAFSTDLTAAIRENDIIILAVGTPTDGKGGADISQIISVAEMVGRNMNGEKLLMTKSTVPVGTTLEIKKVISGLSNHPIHVAFNPEFLREGSAIAEFMQPDRTVVGYEDKTTREILTELYAPFTTDKNPIMFTDVNSAEMIKYASNAMLATRISFINEIANLCDKVKADVEDVKRGIGLDKRIGNRFLDAGLGFGGSCFPKDLKSLIATAEGFGEELPLLRAVFKINERMKQVFIDKISRHFGGDLKGRVFAVWGLSFKPDTDDIREAPALEIISRLHAAGAHINAYDPEALKKAEEILGARATYYKNAYAACKDADALLVLTEWNEFRSSDWSRIAALLKTPLLFDGRNIYRPEDMQKRGFIYYSIGRPGHAG